MLFLINLIMSNLLLPYIIRKAQPNERVLIRDHLVPIHLKLSVRNEKELFDQTNELPDDFPALYSEELFLNDKITHYLVAVTNSVDNRIIGSIGILDDEKNYNNDVTTIKTAKLNSFFVSKEYQNMGIGQDLMNEALQQAKLRHIQRIEVLTMREVYDNAIQLYQKYGFTIFKDYKSPHYNIIEMCLFIKNSTTEDGS